MEELSAATQDLSAAAPNNQAAATPTPVVTTTPSTSIEPRGGESIKDIFKSFNLSELLFGIVGTAALYYVIYYYRYNINESKVFKSQTENKLDEIEMKLSDISSSLQKQKQELENNNKTTPAFF
jgi:hypothetical protein